MHETIAYLESNGVHVRRHDKDTASAGEVSVGRMWLDIEDEDPSQYYDTDITVNQAAVSDLIAAAELEGVRVGIYTTKTYWNRIMGGVEGYSQYPLWYPRYDGENSMDFFEPFSGWERAAIKQTAGDAGLCVWSVERVTDAHCMLDFLRWGPHLISSSLFVMLSQVCAEFLRLIRTTWTSPNNSRMHHQKNQVTGAHTFDALPCCCCVVVVMCLIIRDIFITDCVHDVSSKLQHCHR